LRSCGQVTGSDEADTAFPVLKQSELARDAKLNAVTAGRYLALRWPEARLYCWNVQGRYEVDCVIEEGRKTLAIEVTWTSRWQDKDLAGLRAFLKMTPDCQAAILAYNGTQTVRLGQQLWAVPIDALLT
jgi:predicted AAA+ superfamily ATPase